MSEETRNTIIDAAYCVLAEQGYDKASTKAIALEAGVAQGLIGYYFPAKEQLFLEVFRKESEKYCRQLPQMQEEIDGVADVHTLRRFLSNPKNRVSEDPAWIRLRYELFS